MEANRKSRRSKLGYRHLQCLQLFIGFGLLFASRVNISIAIMAMMDKNTANPNFPEYSWSEQTKSYIFSSFFCGYVLLQIPAGGWARRFGARLLMLLSIGINSLLSLLTPLSVSFGDWPLFCVIRFTQGLSQGLLLPALATILTKWAPIEERGSMQTFTYTGGPFGIVLMLASSGKLCSSRWGWPSTFYLPGALGLLWSVIWFVYGANTPRDCRHISENERAMIEESLTAYKEKDKGVIQRPPVVVPWRSIVTSTPFLVLLFNYCANDWCFWTMLTQIPTYIKSVLGKDINSNALFSALPYLCFLTLSLLLCPLASWLEKSKLLHVTVSRKMFNTIGFWIPALGFVSLGYLHTDQADLAIGLLTTAIALSTNLYFGYSVNHFDLAPNLAGTLVGIANCFSSFMGILAPLAVGFIVTDTKNITQWRIVFFLSGAIAFFGNLLFLLFGTTKVQWWNEPLPTHYEAEQMKHLVIGHRNVIVSTAGRTSQKIQTNQIDN
ncbi:putative inorganic phosphate cotransporter [Eurosta solidaginis]|uniref:putative inorganic phosphate cotransporter n=1 Tax=Eurosta solidaginis TaxID=178769 RepID=UPI003530EFF6